MNWTADSSANWEEIVERIRHCECFVKELLAEGRRNLQTRGQGGFYCELLRWYASVAGIWQTRNPIWPEGHRGFKSLPLRQTFVDFSKPRFGDAHWKVSKKDQTRWTCSQDLCGTICARSLGECFYFG